MDAVRFGRALGLGARQAAKTVISAVDAARAESPSGPTPAARPASASSANRTSSAAASSVPRTSSAVVAPPAPPAAMPNLQRRATDPAPNANRPAKSAARTASGGDSGPRREGGLHPLPRLDRRARRPPLRRALAGGHRRLLRHLRAFDRHRHLAPARSVAPRASHPATHGGLLVAVAVFSLFKRLLRQQLRPRQTPRTPPRLRSKYGH